VDPFVGEDPVWTAPTGGVGSPHLRHLLVEFDEGELRGPVDRDDEMELALRGSHLGDVIMEIAGRIGLELALRRGFAFDLRQPRNPNRFDLGTGLIEPRAELLGRGRREIH
jgi:hypothetical protein